MKHGWAAAVASVVVSPACGKARRRPEQRHGAPTQRAALFDETVAAFFEAEPEKKGD